MLWHGSHCEMESVSLTLHWEWNLWLRQPTEHRRKDTANFQKWALRDRKPPFRVSWNTCSWSLRCHGRSSTSLRGRTPGGVCHEQLETKGWWAQRSPAFQPKQQAYDEAAWARQTTQLPRGYHRVIPVHITWCREIAHSILPESWSVRLRDIMEWLC